jgi:thiol-disulfide isomerase/thioredoxin
VRSARQLLAATAVGAFCGSLAAGELEPWKGASAAPQIELLRTDGLPLSLAQLRGKVVLVNFWATWCEPCVTEMPSLQRLRDQLGPEGFEVLGVNIREGPARIDPFVQKLGISFPIVRDTDGAVTKAWGVGVYPTSFIVDRAGAIRYRLVGESEWTTQAVLSRIRPLLGPAPRR